MKPFLTPCQKQLIASLRTLLIWHMFYASYVVLYLLKGCTYVSFSCMLVKSRYTLYIYATFRVPVTNLKVITVHKGPLCIIPYNCLSIYNDLNKKSQFKK